MGKMQRQTDELLLNATNLLYHRVTQVRTNRFPLLHRHGLIPECVGVQDKNPLPDLSRTKELLHDVWIVDRDHADVFLCLY
jgi:hypothetical protein